MSDKQEFDNFNEFKKKYIELLNLVYEKSNDQNVKTCIDNINDDELDLLIIKFCKKIESDKSIKKLFLNRNEKLFSEKNNIKLISNFNFKAFLSKNSDNSYIWECIQLLYAIYRTGDNQYKDFVNKTIHKIESSNFSSGKDNTNNVDNIIMDIADTLRDNLVADSKKNEQINPIENMMKTSQMIATKYGEQLKGGSITMNDMFSSLGKMIEKIDENANNDEELKNINPDRMPDPESLIKEMGLGDLGDTGNPMDMISSLMGKTNSAAKKDLTPEQLKEMEEFYSTLDSKDIKIDENINCNEQDIILDESLQDLESDIFDDKIEILEDKNKDNINSENVAKNKDNMEVNFGNKINELNKQLISNLPDNQKKDFKKITENMMNIMQNITE